MAKLNFNAQNGITIGGVTTDTQKLVGTGLPGLITASQIAPVGSTYVDTLTGYLYNKTSVGITTANWSINYNENVSPFIDIRLYGFMNQTETTLTLVGNTVTVTPVGVDWSYYRAGKRNTITTAKSVAVTAATGTYFVYMDDDLGTLSMSTTVWDLNTTQVPVAIVVYNSTSSPVSLLLDERHTCKINRHEHIYLHRTQGTKFVSGGTLAGYTVTGTTDLNNTFSIAATTIADEDIFLTNAAMAQPNGTTASYPIAYRTSPTTWAWTTSPMPYKYTSAGFIEYDNPATGTMVEGNGLSWYNTYLFYTNSLTTGFGYIIVHGRAQHATAASAVSEDPLLFDWTGFPFTESVIGYRLTWQTSISGAQKGKAFLYKTPTLLNESINAVPTAIWNPNPIFNNLTIDGTFVVDGSTSFLNSSRTVTNASLIEHGGLDNGTALTYQDNLDKGILFNWFEGASSGPQTLQIVDASSGAKSGLYTATALNYQMSAGGQITIGGTRTAYERTTPSNSTWIYSLQTSCWVMISLLASANVGTTTGSQYGAPYYTQTTPWPAAVNNGSWIRITAIGTAGGTIRQGFYGFDNTTMKWSFVPRATNTAGVISGAIGELDANILFSKITSTPTTLAGYGVTDAVSNLNLTPGIFQDIFANRPVAPTDGTIFIDKTNNKIQRYNLGTTAWVDISGSSATAVSSQEVITSTSSTGANVIDSFDPAVYRSCKYTMQLSQGASYHVNEIRVFHDGTTADIVVYGEMFNISTLGTFTVAYGATVDLIFTPISAVLCSIKAEKILLKV